MPDIEMMLSSKYGEPPPVFGNQPGIERAGQSRGTYRVIFEVPVNFLQRRGRFDDFIGCYNKERPHQALDMQCPAERYVASTRPYQGLPELDYPRHDNTVTVTNCVRICFNRPKINLSRMFPGRNVDSKQ